MSRRTCRVKLVPMGVDIIDDTGDVLAGITNQEAVELLLSLSKVGGRVIHRAWVDAGRPIRGKPTAKRK